MTWSDNGSDKRSLEFEIPDSHVKKMKVQECIPGLLLPDTTYLEADPVIMDPQTPAMTTQSSPATLRNTPNTALTDPVTPRTAVITQRNPAILHSSPNPWVADPVTPHTPGMTQRSPATLRSMMASLKKPVLQRQRDVEVIATPSQILRKLKRNARHGNIKQTQDRRTPRVDRNLSVSKQGAEVEGNGSEELPLKEDVPTKKAGRNSSPSLVEADFSRHDAASELKTTNGSTDGTTVIDGQKADMTLWDRLADGVAVVATEKDGISRSDVHRDMCADGAARTSSSSKRPRLGRGCDVALLVPHHREIHRKIHQQPCKMKQVAAAKTQARCPQSVASTVHASRLIPTKNQPPRRRCQSVQIPQIFQRCEKAGISDEHQEETVSGKLKSSAAISNIGKTKFARKSTKTDLSIAVYDINIEDTDETSSVEQAQNRMMTDLEQFQGRPRDLLERYYAARLMFVAGELDKFYGHYHLQ